ncbi:MAG: hypothetical protein ACI80S_002049 [Pseudohongiellaceae bacterium]
MFKFTFILLVGFIVGAVVVENKQYFTETIATPVSFLPDGGEYDGELLKGELNGKGRIVWPNGDIYEGEFKQGLFHGQGRYEIASNIYTGEFFKGVARGEGSIAYSDGRKYEGDVDFGEANGVGLLRFDNKQYTGDFKDNLFHGVGELLQNNGDIYAGKFANGLPNGQGLATFSDGRVYQGQFVDGALTGEGDFRDGEIIYTGGFKDWLFSGKGRYQYNNITYVGDFSEGRFDGVGRQTLSDNVSYEGEFVGGNYHGLGVLLESGDRYEGEFESGVKHGSGRLIYAKALDGIKEIEGVWVNNTLVSADNDLAQYNSEVVVEDVLYKQSLRLDAMLELIEAENPSAIDMYFVGIAGDGSEGVFRREVETIKNIFDENYETKNKSALLINSNVTYQNIPLATITSIEKTLQGVSAKMDADNDILFIYFTSHGSKDFDFSLAQDGLTLMDLSAQRMGEIVRGLPVKHKVIVVSSCYAGGYLETVKDDTSLVIVASSADKTSFGCADAREMTYFGEAFFKDALANSPSFVEAFDRSRSIVRGREAKENVEHSVPLIFKPKAIIEHLVKWREELADRLRQRNIIIE